MLDTSDEWVPNIHSSRPITGFTKLYWNADIESIRERYDEAKAMCAQEEWLKGLESEGQTNKVDVARMESFESRWSAQRKAKLIGSTPKTSVSTHIEGRGNAQRGPIPNTWAHQQNTAMQSNLPSHQHPIHSHQHGHPSQPPTMQINYVHNGPHLNGQIMMFSGQHGQPGIGGQWQGIHSQGEWRSASSC